MEKPDVNRHEYVCGLCPLDSNIHTVSESSPNLIARFCDFKGNSIEQNQCLHRSVSVDWSCPAACHRHCDKTTLLQDIPCATSGWWCLPMGCCPRSEAWNFSQFEEFWHSSSSKGLDRKFGNLFLSGVLPCSRAVTSTGCDECQCKIHRLGLLT